MLSTQKRFEVIEMPKEFVENRFIRKNTIESRSYQANLAESVLKGGNSLVVAPTALGKTIVAVLVAADRLEKEKKGKILFLAPTKPLCEQHQKTMQKLMKLGKEKIILLTGSIVSKKRAAEWEKASIVIATPQTIENDARKKRISLENVSLIIFDEAHRAMGDYAYVYLAKKYMNQNKKGVILALTASPGGEEKHIKDVCSNLFVKNIEIKALGDEDVKPYSHEIKFEWRMVELPKEFKTIKKLIEAFMKRQAQTLQKFGIIKSAELKWLGKARLIQMQNTLRKRIAASRQKNPSIFAAVTAVAALMKASHAHTLLETQGVNALHAYLEREKEKKGKVTRATSLFLGSMEMVQAAEMAAELNAKGIIHPKFQTLKQELKHQFELRPESSVIVFNHYRDSIKKLTVELSKMPGIRAERFVGQAARGKEKGMTQKEQAAKIQELKEGKINTLVCSSVGEEGLDIPSVDLVIFYEPVPSEIRFIQRRGRTGRLAAGRAIVLMAKNTRDEVYYWTSLRKEKKMHKILHKMKGDSKGDGEAYLKENGGNPISMGNKGNSSSREKQTTLHSFSNGGNGRIVVYADSREQDSSVIGLLKELECEVVLKQLEVGDYIPSKHIAIERKTVSDFLNSIVDGRLSQQLMSLNECYERPLVIVEGDRNELFTSRNIHRNAVIGMLTSIALNYRVPLLFTDGARETAQYIYVIAKREQLGKGADLRIRIGRKGLTLGEQQRFIVESLPLVGPMTAKKLLEHFGSVKAILNAEAKELQKVEQMGKEKAKKIKKVLEAEWEKK